MTVPSPRPEPRPMPPPRDDPAIWIQRYIVLQKDFDVQINKLLREAARSAAQRAETAAAQARRTGGIGAQVRSTQLLSAQTAITNALAEFWRNLRKTVQAGQQRAATEALRTSFSWDRTLLNNLDPSLGINASEQRAMYDSLMQTANRNVEAMLARVFGGRIPLSDQVYRTQQLANGWVDRTVNNALARGASPLELAKDVRQSIRPDTKGGVSYAAKRLGRTEINNAYHGLTIYHNSDKPWVLGMNWRLSGSHPKYDECDILAEQSPFPKEDVPRKPHPQCLCSVYPALPSMEEFNDNFRKGVYDSWLNIHYTIDPGAAGSGTPVA